MNEEHSVIHEPYFSNCLITNLKNSHLQWVARSQEQSSEVCRGLQALPKCPHWLKKNRVPISHWISLAAELALKILQELGTRTQFLQAQPATWDAKGKDEKKLEVHRLNKKSLQDHLTLWPKLIAKSDYVIPLPRRHVMVQQCYQAPLLTYLSRVAKGRRRTESHKYMYI